MLATDYVAFSNISNSITFMKDTFTASKKLAKAMRQVLEFYPRKAKSGELKLVINGKTFEMPKDFEVLLLSIAESISASPEIIILSTSEYMTTQEAADYLEVSRPTLIKMLDLYSIPYELVGRHRRIQTKLVRALKDNRQIMREAILQEMSNEDQSLGRQETKRPVNNEKS